VLKDIKVVYKGCPVSPLKGGLWRVGKY